MKALQICRSCRRYTMRATCLSCGLATASPHPARFSVGDKYAKYRWMLIKEAERDGRDSA